jgi:hypothetical protein
MNKFQKFILNHDKSTFEVYYRTHLNEDVFKQYPEIIDLHDLGKIRKLWDIPAKTKEEKAAIIENFCGGHDFYLNLAKQTKSIMQEKYDGHCSRNKEVQQKRKATCLARYRTDSYFKTDEFKQKAKQTNLAKYGVEHASQAAEVRAKQQNTLQERYGVDNPFKSKEIMSTVDKKARLAKSVQTKRNNQTFTKSASEEAFYEELLKYFCYDDIYRQYSDNRYPFRCDFYIKSLDLFIEVNLHWTHYTHPFDPTKSEDLNQLEIFRLKNTKGYDKLIEVWTIRDPEKQKAATASKINYRVLYNKQDITNLLTELKGD